MRNSRLFLVGAGLCARPQITADLNRAGAETRPYCIATTKSGGKHPHHIDFRPYIPILFKKGGKQPLDAKSLRRSFIGAVIAVIALLISVTGATFAWYVYNTSVHTTDIHLAAGAGVSIEIATEYAGQYGSAVELEPFEGLLDPVSTDSILNGFQKVTEWRQTTEADNTEVKKLAFKFGESEVSDYFKTSLWIRTRGAAAPVYISDIGFEDEDPEKPISTAIRIGFVVHEPGENGKEKSEYIFSISDEKNPEKEYNTEQGQEGHVLDSTKTDGSTVAFTPLNSDAYAIYDRNTGETTLKDTSVPIMTLPAGRNGPGESVQVDVYIWLEGCDEDCTVSIAGSALKDIAIQFSAAFEE